MMAVAPRQLITHVMMATLVMMATFPAAAADALNDDYVETTVAELLAKMTVGEKAAQLDIWRTADILTNGHVDMAKATKSWGAGNGHGLTLGAGVLHDVYPYPQIGNEMVAALTNASRLKIPPLIGGEATHGLQMDDRECPAAYHSAGAPPHSPIGALALPAASSEARGGAGCRHDLPVADLLGGHLGHRSDA
jgi:hypothetical protein